MVWKNTKVRTLRNGGYGIYKACQNKGKAILPILLTIDTIRLQAATDIAIDKFYLSNIFVYLSSCFKYGS
jgi:hypothetical protein